MADSNRKAVIGFALPYVVWTSTDETYRIVVVRVAQGTADFIFEQRTGSDAMNVLQWTRFEPIGAPCNLIKCIAYEKLEEVYPQWRSWGA